MLLSGFAVSQSCFRLLLCQDVPDTQHDCCGAEEIMCE
jgi:hypothetical protein